METTPDQDDTMNQQPETAGEQPLLELSTSDQWAADVNSTSCVEPEAHAETNLLRKQIEILKKDQIDQKNRRRSAEKLAKESRQTYEAEREKNSELQSELNSVESELINLKNTVTQRLSGVSEETCNIQEHQDLEDRLDKALEALEHADQTIKDLQLQIEKSVEVNIEVKPTDHADDIRRKSSTKSYMHALSGGDVDKEPRETESSMVIPGSESVKAGGIIAKSGTRMGYTTQNEYWEVTRIKLQSDEEKDKAPMTQEEELQLRKALRSANYLSEKQETELETLSIPAEESFEISVFVRMLTTVLQKLGCASLVSKTFGWMDEFAEVVGTPGELKTWPAQMYGFLDLRYGEKFWTAITNGSHKKLSTAFKKHTRSERQKKSLGELAEVCVKTLQYQVSGSECRKLLKLLSIRRKGDESDEDFLLRVLDANDRVREKMKYIDVEDLHTCNIMTQMGSSVVHDAGDYIKLWTSGLCGIQYIDSLCEHIIDIQEKSQITLGKGKSNRMNPKATRPATRESEGTKQGKPCKHCARHGCDEAKCKWKDAKCFCCNKTGHIGPACDCEKCKGKTPEQKAKIQGVKAPKPVRAAKKSDGAKAEGGKSEVKGDCQWCGKTHYEGQKCKLYTQILKDAGHDQGGQEESSESDDDSIKSAYKQKLAATTKRLKKAEKRYKELKAMSEEDSSSDDFWSSAESSDLSSDEDVVETKVSKKGRGSKGKARRSRSRQRLVKRVKSPIELACDLAPLDYDSDGDEGFTKVSKRKSVKKVVSEKLEKAIPFCNPFSDLDSDVVLSSGDEEGCLGGERPCELEID